MKRRKIWVGLGTAVLAVSPAAAETGAEFGLPSRSAVSARSEGALVRPAVSARTDGALVKPTVSARSDDAALVKMAQHAGHGVKPAAMTGGEGEGGEGEGGAAASLPAPIRFYRDIGLIRGHLLIGNELVEAGRWAEALPHILQPTEEIYPGMRDDLKSFGVAPFQTALKALAQTVKAKNKEAYGRARATLAERLDAAENAVRSKESDVPSFTLETVMEMLQTASDEYEEAIEKGRIANVVEYQDARGFVFEADRLVSAQADTLAARNQNAMKAIRASLDDLKAIFPAPMPPKQPVKDVGGFLSDVSKIELQLGNLR
jgi:hypothetical protein